MCKSGHAWQQLSDQSGFGTKEIGHKSSWEMECIAIIVSETIGEETFYLERHEDFEEGMARTKRTLNKGQFDKFVQQGFTEAIQRQVQNPKPAHPWTDKEIYNYILENRHKVVDKAKRNVGLAAGKQPELQPVEVVTSVDKDQPNLTDTGQEPSHGERFEDTRRALIYSSESYLFNVW